MGLGVGTDIVVVTATMVLSGLVTGWLGYRIRYRGDTHLIAGYRSDVAADTDGLARAVGRVVLLVAVVTLVAGLSYPVLEVDTADELAYWSAYTLVVLALAGYAVVASRRYVSGS
jgi:hypothetical protein